VFNAIQYLAGRQTREKLEALRGYGGAQFYPSRTKDIDDVDFSTRVRWTGRRGHRIFVADPGLHSRQALEGPSLKDA
jgi:hypothetical protein